MDTKGSDRRLERPHNPETQSGTRREVQATIRAERSNDPALNFDLVSSSNKRNPGRVETLQFEEVLRLRDVASGLLRELPRFRAILATGSRQKLPD
jgi:hypothetical protein